MQVHDRGTMKWVSLMLPEHVELLREAFITYEDKPLLDEQKMLEIDRTLKYALKNKEVIKMTYFRQGTFYSLVSKLEKIDQWRGFILLQSDKGEEISLSDIVDVQLV